MDFLGGEMSPSPVASLVVLPTLSDVSYFCFSCFPISWNGESCLQHVRTVQDPDTPWHLQVVSTPALMTCRHTRPQKKISYGKEKTQRKQNKTKNQKDISGTQSWWQNTNPLLEEDRKFVLQEILVSEASQFPGIRHLPAKILLYWVVNDISKIYYTKAVQCCLSSMQTEVWSCHATKRLIHIRIPIYLF